MKLCFSILFLLLNFSIHAQNKVKYWFFVQDEYSLESITDSLKIYYISVENKSDWFHALTFSIDEQQHYIFRKKYCSSFQKVKKLSTNHYTTEETKEKQLSALEEMKAYAITEYGLTGKGVKVGIIDAGYQRADSNEYFTELFKRNAVKAYKDFVNPTKTDFYAKEFKGDSHGREVWKRIGGYSKKKNLTTGLATGADYYLARSENADVEQRIEEDNWVAAIEWMDSLGVRLVNTSLGYANMFDDSTDNYTIEDMNGNTSVISKAAKKAILEKNMIIVSSAGNEGRNKNWQVVTAPADVEEIITVGAIKPGTRIKADYSSIGTNFTSFNKPDVVCASTSGTSFASPIIAGLVACLLEKSPEITYDSVKSILYNSSSISPYPNNHIGYGMPDCQKIVAILEGKGSQNNSQKSQTSETKFKTNLENSDSSIILYHKVDKTVVTETVEINTSSILRLSKKYKFKNRKKGNKLLIYKPEGVKYTTIDTGEKIIEVEWMD